MAKRSGDRTGGGARPPAGEWQNEYAQPTAEGLLAAVPSPAAGPVLELHDALGAVHGPPAVWHLGIPWRWTLVYGMERDDPNGAAAYLSPNPAAPVLCIRLSQERFGEAEAKRLPRSVRESLATARVVRNVLWPEWELTGETKTEELIAFLELTRQPAQSD